MTQSPTDYAHNRIYEFDQQDALLSAWCAVYDSLFFPMQNEADYMRRVVKNYEQVFKLAKQEVKGGKPQVWHNYCDHFFYTTKPLVIGAISVLDFGIKLNRELARELPELEDKYGMRLRQHLRNHDDLMEILSGYSPPKKREKPPPKEARQLIFEYAKDKRRRELVQQGIDARGPVQELKDLAAEVPF